MTDQSTMQLDQQRAKVIVKQVYNYLKVDPTETRRKRDAVEARYFAMFYCKHYTRLSLVKIGQLFGKDHSTVIHACKTAQTLIEWNGYEKQDGRMRFYIERELSNVGDCWMNKVAQL